MQGGVKLPTRNETIFSELCQFKRTVYLTGDQALTIQYGLN